jgi:hypothetical protein
MNGALPDPEADRPGRRYEYTTVEVHEPMDIESLDALGKQSWRLCVAMKYAGVIVYHFMRPVRSEPP